MTQSNRFSIFIKITLASLAIFCISMWAYYGTTKNAFVWDTTFYIYNHVFYLSYASIDNIIWMFTTLDNSNWHPLTWLSWAIDYQIYGGFSTWGFHLTSNILHSINGILVFFVTLVLFGLNNSTKKRYPISTSNSALVAALFTALLWSIHPQHVESVAWVAERKDLLCQLFLLLSMLTYVKFVSCDDEMKRRWYYVTLGMFLLAIMSKPMAVTFPAILLLLDVYPLRRTNLLPSRLSQIKTETYSKLSIEKIPFFLLSLFLALITLQAQSSALVSVPLDLRLLNAFNSITMYLEKLLVPNDFSPLYAYFISSSESITWKSFLPLVSFLLISSSAIVAWVKGRPSWLIAWMFYLITLLPVLGLIQVGQQGAADRYAYLPTLPMYLLFGAGLLWILKKAKIWQQVALILVIVTVSYGLIVKTQQQILIWKSGFTLWTHTVALNPDNIKSLHNLAILQFHRQEFYEAADNFSRVVDLKPESITSKGYRAITYLNLEQYADAIKDYSELESEYAANPDVRLDWNCVYFNIGWANAQLLQFEQAINNFAKVNSESQLGPDASIWLADLKNKTALPFDAVNLKESPGFCSWVLQERMPVKGKRPDEAMQ